MFHYFLANISTLEMFSQGRSIFVASTVITRAFSNQTSKHHTLI